MTRFDSKPFRELSPQELYDVLELRQRVFVVEQACAYLDCDGYDVESLHLMGRDRAGKLSSYARLLPPGLRYREASIGRVVTHPAARRSGLGRELMTESIARVRDLYPGPIRIAAQRYLERFYGDFGFVVAGEPYEEDGIPHIEMLLLGS